MHYLDGLRDARREGVKIEVVDGDLLITADEAVLMSKWRPKLKLCRDDIVAHLCNGTAKTNGAAVDDPEPPAPIIPGYVPFPVHTLPAAVGKFVAAASTAIGCDPSIIALPLLACLARAIGNKRVIRLKPTWKEPAIIWAAIVGKSGTHKTPSLQAAMQYLQRKEADAFAAHGEAADLARPAATP